MNDRDRLAEALGWTKYDKQIGTVTIVKWHKWPAEDTSAHPIPENDLDVLAALWPDRYDIIVLRCTGAEEPWLAEAVVPHKHFTDIKRTGKTEFEARLRLTLAALEADNAARAGEGKTDG